MCAELPRRQRVGLKISQTSQAETLDIRRCGTIDIAGIAATAEVVASVAAAPLLSSSHVVSSFRRFMASLFGRFQAGRKQSSNLNDSELEPS